MCSSFSARLFGSSINSSLFDLNTSITEIRISDEDKEIILEISSKPDEIHQVDQDLIKTEIEIKALESDDSSETKEELSELLAKFEELKTKSAELSEVWEKEKKTVFEIQQAKKDFDGIIN